MCCLAFRSINVYKHPYTLALHARLTLPVFGMVACCGRGEGGLKEVNPDFYLDELVGFVRPCWRRGCVQVSARRVLPHLSSPALPLILLRQGSCNHPSALQVGHQLSFSWIPVADFFDLCILFFDVLFCLVRIQVTFFNPPTNGSNPLTPSRSLSPIELTPISPPRVIDACGRHAAPPVGV